MFFTNAFYLYRKFSTNRDFSHLVHLKKMSSNVLLTKERIKLSWNQLPTCTSLHQSQKEIKRKIQHDDVNNVRKNKSRKESRDVSGYCKDHPALCIHPCFCLYHQDIGLAKHPEEVTIEVAEEVWNFDCRLDLIKNENKQENNCSYLFCFCKFTPLL